MMTVEVACIIGIFVGIVVFICCDEDELGIVLALSGFTLSIVLLASTIKYNPITEERCRNANISYELFKTLVETTDKDEYDVYVIMKQAAAADMDLYEAVMLIDPDLTQQEAAAIVQISDYKQSKGDN
jgi:hypothetical protein